MDVWGSNFFKAIFRACAATAKCFCCFFFLRVFFGKVFRHDCALFFTSLSFDGLVQGTALLLLEESIVTGERAQAKRA